MWSVYTGKWLKKKKTRLPFQGNPTTEHMPGTSMPWPGWWQVVEKMLTNGKEVTRLVRDKNQACEQQ
mgnify:CR=1 FL=1|eukprot:XP_001701219.1 predicted protein [Chlamydomonas reinhardtii]